MNCPSCGAPLREGTSDGHAALFCARCWEIKTPPPPQASEPTLALLPGRHSRKTILREEPAQEKVVTALRYDGYTVLVTSKHRKRTYCNPEAGGCGRWFFPSEGDGCDKGIPDLLVTHPSWPSGVMLGIECKGTDTPASEDQERLAAQGRIRILRAQESYDWTVTEARRYVREFEAALGIEWREKAG